MQFDVGIYFDSFYPLPYIITGKLNDYESGYYGYRRYFILTFLFWSIEILVK